MDPLRFIKKLLYDNDFSKLAYKKLGGDIWRPPRRPPPRHLGPPPCCRILRPLPRRVQAMARLTSAAMVPAGAPTVPHVAARRHWPPEGPLCLVLQVENSTFRLHRRWVISADDGTTTCCLLSYPLQVPNLLLYEGLCWRIILMKNANDAAHDSYGGRLIYNSSNNFISSPLVESHGELLWAVVQAKPYCYYGKYLYNATINNLLSALSVSV